MQTNRKPMKNHRELLGKGQEEGGFLPEPFYILFVTFVILKNMGNSHKLLDAKWLSQIYVELRKCRQGQNRGIKGKLVSRLMKVNFNSYEAASSYRKNRVNNWPMMIVPVSLKWLHIYNPAVYKGLVWGIASIFSLLGHGESWRGALEWGLQRDLIKLSSR